MAYFAIIPTHNRGRKFMFKEIQNSQPCSVSEDFINMIANQFPDKLMKKGVVDVQRTLHLLGFRTGLFDYVENKDVYIRDNKQPSRVYKGNFITGRLRNDLKKKGVAGYELYNYMENICSKIDVLQPSDLTAEVFKNIMEIGDLAEYSK